MRGDLNDQFQRAQAADESDGTNKWIVALIIAIVGVFALVIILGTVFFVKTLDKIVDTVPSGENTTSTNTNSTEFDPFNPSSNSGYTSGGGSNSTTVDYKNNFEYGTVTGTSYYSSFSGVSFNSPSDWSVTGYGTTNSYNLMSIKDMTASSNDLSVNVSISYNYMQSITRTSAAGVLEKYKKTATEGVNNSIVNDNVTANYGGNSFTGIVYKKTMDSNFSYFTEVLVTEVNGYVLEIYVEANSEEDLASTMSMFK